MLRLAGQAPFRLRPLSSNVRPQMQATSPSAHFGPAANAGVLALVRFGRRTRAAVFTARVPGTLPHVGRGFVGTNGRHEREFHFQPPRSARAARPLAVGARSAVRAQGTSALAPRLQRLARSEHLRPRTSQHRSAGPRTACPLQSSPCASAQKLRPNPSLERGPPPAGAAMRSLSSCASQRHPVAAAQLKR